MDKLIKEIAQQEIKRLEKENATMKQQVEQEINKNNIYIFVPKFLYFAHYEKITIPICYYHGSRGCSLWRR